LGRLTAEQIARGVEGGNPLFAAAAPAYVVKPKGGNWIAGSVERAVDPMRVRVMGSDPATRLRDLDASYAQNLEAGVAIEPAFYAQQRAQLEPDAALNKWLETKLTKYIKNDMATPEDPVRLLAERGITHARNYQAPSLSNRVQLAREQAGFNPRGEAVGPEAVSWENRADRAVTQNQARDLLDDYAIDGSEASPWLNDNPWLAKVPPETSVNRLNSGLNIGNDLGFNHLVDELKNSINPESGLPRELMLKYSDLDKVTVPQAVERVARINDWRAAQQVEADMVKAMNPATQVIKEYPESGTKWVELKTPDMPEGWTEQVDALGVKRLVGPKGEDTLPGNMNDPRRAALEDALKYEGETMGHCVGGYCPDVVEGRSKIFSLRDDKGRPHVTIEVKPGTYLDYNGWFKKQPEEIQNKIAERRLVDRNHNVYEGPEYLAAREALPPQIVQIKGKGNKAPNEEYLPAVQDFVRSGNWGDVGDLENTGLYRKSNFIDEFSPEKLDAIGQGEYLTMEEIKKMREGGAWKPIDTDPDLDIDPGVLGFAEGGYVDYDPARIDEVMNRTRAGFAAGGVVNAGNETPDYDDTKISSIVAQLHKELNNG
jgi:hypothetical protein